jgi:hypothetical protein
MFRELVLAIGIPLLLLLAVLALDTVDQPSSQAVATTWPFRQRRKGTGVPWSNRIRTHATAAAVPRAACSSTERACSCVTPGKRSTNSARETPSSRF